MTFKAALQGVLAALTIAYVVAALALSGIPGLSKSAMVLAVLLVVTTGAGAVTGRLKVRTWVLAPLLFLFVCLLNAMRDWNMGASTFYSTSVAWVGAVAVGVCIENGTAVRWPLWGMVIAAVANLCAVVLGFDAYAAYTADFTRVSEDALSLRAGGLTGNANQLAVQAIFPLVLLALIAPKSSKVLWSAFAVCAVHALFVSGSRKGAILLAVFAIWKGVEYLKDAPTSRRARAVILLVAVASFGAIAFGVGRMGGEVVEIGAISRLIDMATGREDSFLERLNLVGLGYRLFVERPIIGYGLDSFRYVSGMGVYSHNNLVELLVSGGVVLALSYYGIIAAFAFGITKRNGAFDATSMRATLVLLIIAGLGLGMVSFGDKFLSLCLVMVFADSWSAAGRSHSGHAAGGVGRRGLPTVSRG